MSPEQVDKIVSEAIGEIAAVYALEIHEHENRKGNARKVNERELIRQEAFNLMRDIKRIWAQ